MHLAQSKQISSFDFGETNSSIVFVGLRHSSAELAKDVIPFLARNENENLLSQTSRPFAASSLAHPSRVRKIQFSLAKTFSPGILVRSTCGKSNYGSSGERSLSKSITRRF